MTDVSAHAHELAEAVRGGRVASTTFLEEAEAAALLARLRRDGVACSAWGGMPAASRRIVTARPAQIPEAAPKFEAVKATASFAEEELLAALLAAGIERSDLGDAFATADGSVVLLTERSAKRVPDTLMIASVPVHLDRAPADEAGWGRGKQFDRVVASLRADVIGAAAFGASRTWFSKGVAAGKVRIDGERVGKASTLEVGSELWAEGLGRAILLEVLGTTKRGNVRVRLRTETPPDAR